jgi:hypothetical protein
MSASRSTLTKVRCGLKLRTFRSRNSTCATRYIATPPQSATAGMSFSGSPTSPSVFFTPTAKRMIPATIGRCR